MGSSQRRNRSLISVSMALALVLLISALWFAAGRAASDPSPTKYSPAPSALPVASVLAQSAEPLPHPGDDLQCRICHEGSQAILELPDGSQLPVAVDPQTLADSVHGASAEEPLNCTSCHAAGDYQFPHGPTDAADLRSFQIARSESCLSCHQRPHETAHAGPDSDNQVVCTDCHGSHEVMPVATLTTPEGVQACVNCHTKNDVPQTDPEILETIIRDGLFTSQVDNQYCLACHDQPGRTLTLDNGEELSLTVDRTHFGGSVHGADNPWQPLNCTDCHENYRFPHEAPANTGSLREYTVANSLLCHRCHEQNAEKAVDDVHGALVAGGNLDGAVCTDCHGAHDTPPPNQPRQRISETCAQCHQEIHDEYVDSVHGEALAQNSNPDVPTCIDCHGVHNIQDPTTTLYRSRSPLICARCHADKELMTKYEISTSVFDTYVSDFHGTSAVLFDPAADPNAPFNEAVCYDCHGVHDIRRPDDPENGIQANLLETCQKCHPNATENFPAAWTSHYEPSLQNNTGVFLVETFYRIVIPMTLIGFGFLVATDIFRRVRLRFGRQLE